MKVFADQGISPIPVTPARSVRDEVETFVGQELREAGLRVEDKGTEALFKVSLCLQCQPQGTACGHVTSVELMQWTVLERDGANRSAAITWRNSYSNGVPRFELMALPDLLVADARTLVAAFVQDFRAANR